jgi:hypothetical protein
MGLKSLAGLCWILLWDHELFSIALDLHSVARCFGWLLYRDAIAVRRIFCGSASFIADCLLPMHISEVLLWSGLCVFA